MAAKEICEDCGNLFLAGPNEFVCQECRKRRLSGAAKRRGLNRLGLEAQKKKGGDRDV